jgi:hypothetical protein
MRETKFRAWHEGKMYRVLVLLLGQLEQTVTLVQDEGPYVTVPLDEVELLQYTGLKDKNGKDVYEGDIIKVAKNSRLFHVIWNEWAFCWDLAALNTEGSPVAFTGLPHATFDAIGTIYENPDLIPEH